MLEYSEFTFVVVLENLPKPIIFLFPLSFPPVGFSNSLAGKYNSGRTPNGVLSGTNAYKHSRGTGYGATPDLADSVIAASASCHEPPAFECAPSDQYFFSIAVKFNIPKK